MATRQAYRKAPEIYDEVCTSHTVVIKSYEAYKVLSAT